MELAQDSAAERRACSWLTSKERECGQGQNRTVDARIFSPHTGPRLCVTIGHQVNEFKRLKALFSHPIYRFEHIVLAKLWQSQ
jgi:hypothetical protein